MSTSLSPRSSMPHPTRQQLDELDALLQRMLELPVNQVEEDQGPAPVPAAPVKEPRPTLPPVSYSDGTTDAPPPPAVKGPSLEQRIVPPTAAHEEPPAVVETERQGGEGENWVPFKSSWEPSSLTWQPLQENWKQVQAELRHRRGQPTEPMPLSNPPASATPMSPPEPEETSDLAPTRSRTPEPAPALIETPVIEKPTAVPESAAPRWWQWPLLGFNVVFDLLLLPLGPLGGWLRGSAGRRLLGSLGLLALAGAGALALADWIGWTW
jgi:hypothetical protein